MFILLLIGVSVLEKYLFSSHFEISESSSFLDIPSPHTHTTLLIFSIFPIITHHILVISLVTVYITVTM